MKIETEHKLHKMSERAPLGYLLHEVSKLMKRRFEEQAKAWGITLPQWRALAHIALNENITQVALAQAIDADPMTISGILDRLAKRGLIERYAAPSDSRAKLVRLTDDGQAIFETAKDVGSSMYQSALTGVSPEHIAITQAVLRQMRDNLAAQSAELEEV